MLPDVFPKNKNEIIEIAMHDRRVKVLHAKQNVKFSYDFIVSTKLSTRCIY